VTHLWTAYSLTRKDSRAGHSHLTNLAHVFFADLVFEEGVIALNGTSASRQPLNRDAQRAAVAATEAAPDARAFDRQTEYA
jgi:hypothetical protein